MRKRTKPLGTKNAIGGQITKIRLSKEIKQTDFISRLQSEGMDINPSSYSKIEGQTRQVTDIEATIIARVLGVPIQELFL